jgi:AAA15 family ATPase/GTPase
MIIDFTIQNFRSIRTEQTLSLHVENAGLHLAQHVAYPAGDKIGVLCSAGIYGANASGKSNILTAFEALGFIACHSGDLKDGNEIPCYEPYRLSRATKELPVKFEIEFFNTDNIRYFYSVSFTQDEIVEEILDYYPTRKKANLFTRTATDTWETISFGGRYKGGTKRIPFFKNNSYLSKVGENAGASDLIRSVYKYFNNNLGVLSLNQKLFHPDFFSNGKMVAETAKFLSYVDTGISDIKTRTKEGKISAARLEKIPEEMRKLYEAMDTEEFLFSHSSEDGLAELFEEKMESAGTQKLFNMIPLLMKAFAAGRVVILDEIDHSLHPHIAEMVIKLFNDPEINTNQAQLIFSTHNTSLMSPDNLRRDQIWFAQKNEGATSFYSLDQYDKSKVKTNSPFPAWYNDGRFGAVPSIDYLSIGNLLRPKQALTDSVSQSQVDEGAHDA